MKTVNIGDLVQLDEDYIDYALETANGSLWIVIGNHFLKSVRINLAKVLTGKGIAYYSYDLLKKA
jgi:hypothetical protein